MKTVSIFAMVLILLGLITTIGLFAFRDGLQHAGCDMEAAALGVLAVCLVACVMGFVSFREPSGKIAAILGALLVAFFVFQFLYVAPDQSRSAQSVPPPAARLLPASLEEMTPLPREQSPREQSLPRREVVAVAPEPTPGNARFEGFRDLRVISTGPVDGPVDNTQNYQFYVGGYAGPFIGPGGYQWAGRVAWPGPRAGQAVYLRYATPPQDAQPILIYGTGGN
ncbi:MAG: hypothetical protein ABFD92_04430 [Planctomycetaceae bacterium]|nr:hypothetical protein [Planctomycetaceae bacterium]